MESQVVSKKRVADHGEVLTGKREVNAMLDLVKQESERIDSRFLEPACGSGGIFVQSARFVAEHQKTPAAELAICGVEMRRDELCSECICP